MTIVKKVQARMDAAYEALMRAAWQQADIAFHSWSTTWNSNKHPTYGSVMITRKESQ